MVRQVCPGREKPGTVKGVKLLMIVRVDKKMASPRGFEPLSPP